MANRRDFSIAALAIDLEAGAAMATDELRSKFHIGDLFQPGRISLTFTHYGRMVVGGAMPIGEALELADYTDVDPLPLETLR